MLYMYFDSQMYNDSQMYQYWQHVFDHNLLSGPLHEDV